MSEVYTISQLNLAALGLLGQIGISLPSEEQINLVEEMLSATTLDCKIMMNKLLTPKQQTCLFWAAQGYTADETAEIMQISVTTVNTHRVAIKQKLKCTTMAQAVYKGMRLGYIGPKDLVQQILN